VNEFKAALDAEIGEPPASTVDVDAVVARQRRWAWVRLAGTGGGAVLAVAGLVAGMAALTGGAPSGGTATAVPAASRSTSTSPQPTCPSRPHRASPTASPSPWITDQAVPTARPSSPGRPLPVGAAPRLTASLKAAVQAEAGALRLTNSRWGALPRPLEFNRGPCEPENSDQYMAAAAILTASGPRIRRGDVFVLMSFDSSQASAECPTTDGTQPDARASCQESHGRGGAVIVASSWYGDRQGTPPATWYDVTISKPDGTVVQLHCGGAGPTRPTPPLTIAQLIAIGEHPGLTLVQ
jgi:hypothetical protein